MVQHQHGTNQTITASANGPTLANSPKNGPTYVSVLVDAPTAPTGTTPTLQVYLAVSADGVRFFRIANTSQLTAAGMARVAPTQVNEPFYRLEIVTTGTTPSWANVNISSFIS